MYIKSHYQIIVMDEISTYLGPKGFTILKEYLDIDDLNLIMIHRIIRLEYSRTNRENEY